MKVLVINAGSSSCKYQLLEMDTETVLASGLAERIGQGMGKLTHKIAPDSDHEEKIVRESAFPTHVEAMELVISLLTDPEKGVIKDKSEIYAIGHRVLHGGESITETVKVDENVKQIIRDCFPLGPLHNPANITGINACTAVMGKDVPQVAVFDTAFHQTMPPKAFLYGLPYEAYKEHMVRRYGFHGTSHMYVSQRALTKLDMPKEDTRIITCHLGNGSSISAIKGGKCVDTSMGLTPLEGVPMGTRCGDMDPAIVTYLMERLNLDKKGIDNYLNKKSGMLGISGVSSDFRDLEEAANNGNERAQLALDTFCYKVKKYIGAYAAALGGVDAIVFTAGVGENDRGVREKVLSGLEYLGVDVDFDFNNSCPRGEEVEISKPTSRVKVFVIPTDEEMMIARDTAALTAK